MEFISLLTLGILHPDKLIRDNGSMVTVMEYSNAYTKYWDIINLFKNVYMLLIFPTCWDTNLFITFESIMSMDIYLMLEHEV